MARTKKIVQKKITEELVTVRFGVSVNGWYRGDIITVPMTSQVQGWLDAGYARIKGAPGGKSEAGQSSAAKDDPGGEPQGAEGSIETGGEQGEGPVPGRHRSPARLDPS